MGGVAKTVKNTFSNPVRGLTAVGTFGTSELARKMGPIPKRLAGMPESIANALLGTKYGNTGTPDVGGSGPFTLDEGQMAANKAAIEGEGQRQYDQSLAAIDENGRAQQEFASQTFSRMLPGIQEDLNAKNLLNSTALQQEIGRQGSDLANQVASQVAQQKLAALGGKQGFQSQALGRGLSLEDFITSSNVAKTIGAQNAPQFNNGKANAGTVMQGVGALAPWFVPGGPLAKAGVAAATQKSGK